MAPPSVVFLDDDEDLRDLFVDMMGLLVHRRCLCLGSVAEMTAQADSVLAAELIVIDINLGPGVPSGLDAYRWLVEHEYRGQIIFLTGHAASHPLVAQARRLGNVRVFEKPLGIPALRELVEQGPH